MPNEPRKSIRPTKESHGYAKDIQATDALILCIKPQDLHQFGTNWQKNSCQTKTVMSILAGTSIATLEHDLGFCGPTIRAMPNIASYIGAGATALCHNSACKEFDKKLAEQVFSTLGEFAWTKETNLNAVTGLSGSGPAYVFMIIEALADGGVKMGLPRNLAMKLAVQTVSGAAEFVKRSGEHPAVLKDMVTTPAGTTISAIHELEERGLRAMLISAVQTATERSAFLQKNKD